MEPVKQYRAAQVEKSDIIQMERGMLPPQAIALEEAVLGAIINDAQRVDECLMILQSSDVFYKESHKYIFDAVLSLYNDNQGIDLLSVSSRLKSMGRLEQAGGDFHLVALTQKAASGAHIEVHSRIVLQHYIKRRIIKSASQFMSNAYDAETDSLDLLSSWALALDEITEMSMQGKKSPGYAELLDKVEERIQFLSHKNPDEISGVCNGIAKINLFTGGYKPGNLIIVAARPGMGKTAYVLNTAIANAKAGVPVGFISAEMSAEELTARTVAIDTDFHMGQVVKTGFDKPEYFTTFSHHKHRMKKYPLYIDDAASPDIRNVMATARQWKRKHGIKLLIVDYLQLCTDATKVSKSGNREQEIAAISRKLKALAKELQIPVIALSQVSRECENRSDKRPKLSDLRESGAIEQDADIVEFLYRAEYYGLPVDDDMLKVNANSEVIFAKFRGGSLGTRGVWWQGDKTKFMDPDVRLAELEEQAARAVHLQGAPLPRPTADEAFGPRSYSIEDKSSNNNGNDDVPF